MRPPVRTETNSYFMSFFLLSCARQHCLFFVSGVPHSDFCGFPRTFFNDYSCLLVDPPLVCKRRKHCLWLWKLYLSRSNLTYVARYLGYLPESDSRWIRWNIALYSPEFIDTTQYSAWLPVTVLLWVNREARNFQAFNVGVRNYTNALALLYRFFRIHSLVRVMAKLLDFQHNLSIQIYSR